MKTVKRFLVVDFAGELTIRMPEAALEVKDELDA